MSGSLIQLVAQGVQDVYITNEQGDSFFKSTFKRHTNFTQAAKLLEIKGQKVVGGMSVIEIDKLGDLINYMWIEGTNLIDYLPGTVFELYIGGKLVDTQTYEFCSDIWTIYMAETKAKSDAVNNKVSQSDKNFFPLHFFFCDNDMFLPLIAMQYHKAEIRIKWGASISSSVITKCYGNYIFLDTDERNKFSTMAHDIVITQTQKITIDSSSGAVSNYDLSYFNHPVKSIFFGFEAKNANPANDFFKFTSADIYLNGSPKIEKMTPNYFHTVQGYYHTTNGLINFDNTVGCPFYTRFYMYSFGRNISGINPNGTCNFSRLDSAKMHLDGITLGSNRSTNPISIYAVNYNVLRVQDGMAGVRFSN